MITRLSAFVFGNHPNDDVSTNPSEETEVEAINITKNVSSSNTQELSDGGQMPTMFSFEDKDRVQGDWVFIDVLNKNIDVGLQENTNAIKIKSDDVAQGIASRSSQSPPPTPNSADSDASGWLVTPPSCFVTRRPLPPIAASPMDNLLIEHPSMSVYVTQDVRNPLIDAIVRAGVIDTVNSAGDFTMDAVPTEEVSNAVPNHENSPPGRQNGRHNGNNNASRNNRPNRGNGRLPTSQIVHAVPHEGNTPPWLLSRQAFRRMSRAAISASKGKRGPPLFQPKPCGSHR